MTDDWKTDIAILHKIIDNHDAVIMMLAEHIHNLQTGMRGVHEFSERVVEFEKLTNERIVEIATNSDENFDQLNQAVRTIAAATVPHLFEFVNAKPKTKLRLLTKDDDA